ncbi:uncharacterized protein LOC120358122 [Solenopsis invicta]|uniref:uncharacterized protein LOC113004789 n=1 Tax=Solenopsis invicta TaxID=13686 RepID=UPI00193E11C1|nr:uncharacterized protein LOC113004789 [Solenopsis invicta]XP_039306800.1 uncharacterized protein LOC120358122 [Solenopsis invicta]
MKLRFAFKAVVSPKDSKSTVAAITSIATEDGEQYAIPDELIYADYHGELTKTENFKKVKESLGRRHDELKIWITLTKELEKTYVDEEGNIQFGGKYLKQIARGHTEENSDLAKILGKLVENSEKKEEEKNLKHIIDKFVLGKFNHKTSNVKQWLDTFEKECGRFNIEKDKTKIELLRAFLDGTCQDWYTSTVIRGEHEDDWQGWKQELIETFANKGWSSRTYAHYFKYKEGSLIQYAIKKERLLLEINKDMDADTMIDRIAFGLPDFIREKIDREEIKNTRDLVNELQKLEGITDKKKTFRKEGKPENRVKNEERKPCKTCEEMDKGARYHPEEKCWFRREEKEKPKAIGSNSVIEVDLSTEKKNE